MSMKQSLLNGISQAASGKELDSNTIDLDNSSAEISSASEDDPNLSVSASESTMEDGLESSAEAREDAPADSSEPSETSSAKEESKDANQKTSGSSKEHKEVITISDDKGRRKVEVDFSNRDQLKKFVQMAYGARKWQAERDQAIAKSKEFETKISERERDWQSLESAFQQGPEHLIDLLAGRKGAFDEFVAQRQQRQDLQKRDPEAFAALEAREEVERLKRENEKARKENESFKKSVTEEREAAEVAAMQASVNPVFEKYRFAEKLGDANDEHMFDEMLWNSAMKRLEPYEDKGLLTSEVIEREFRSVAQAIRKRISGLAEKKATKVVEQKKQEATENVQAKVMSGYKKGGTADEARKLLNNGDIKGILKNWGKYSSVFNRK